MYKPKRYPRQNWRRYSLITAVVVAFVFAIPFGIMTAVRGYHVVHSRHDNVHIQNQNHLFRMIAGVDPVDTSNLGYLAATARQLNVTSDPVDSWRSYYIRPDKFHGAAGEIDVSLYDDQGTQDETDSGFDANFILDALEAAKPTHLSLVEATPPVLRTTGLLDWRYLVGILGGWGVLVLFVVLGLRFDRRRWYRRDREKYFKRLPDQGREAAMMLEQLQSEPYPIDATKKLIKELTAFVSETEQGYGQSGFNIAVMNERFGDLRTSFNEARKFMAKN